MDNVAALGKWLVVAGLILAGVGFAFWLAARTGIPLGRLPGDVHIRRGSTSFYFPIVTMIILSIVLTILLNLVLRILRK